MILENLMDETKPESNVVDFHSRANIPAKTQKLIEQGNIAEALNELSEPIPVDTLEYLYNTASDFFNAGEIENAKIIFLKITDTKNSTNTETKYYVDNSKFNLGIIYTLENNSVMGRLYGNKPSLFGIKFGIQFLLRVYNDYQKFKNEFKILNENFTTQELENLMTCFYTIRKDVEKKTFENNIEIKSFTKNHLLLLEKTFGKERLADKKLLTKVEELAFKFERILARMNTILLGDGSLEINFLEQFQFDKIDLDKNQDYYVKQLYIYLKQKIADVKKCEFYMTTKDEYKPRLLFDSVAEKIWTEQASDSDILYGFLKNCIFYGQSFLAAAILEVFQIYYSNISFPESIKKQIKQNLIF